MQAYLVACCQNTMREGFNLRFQQIIKSTAWIEKPSGNHALLCFYLGEPRRSMHRKIDIVPPNDVTLARLLAIANELITAGFQQAQKIAESSLREFGEIC